MPSPFHHANRGEDDGEFFDAFLAPGVRMNEAYMIYMIISLRNDLLKIMCMQVAKKWELGCHSLRPHINSM
jgi:hypothetical protein